MLIVNVQGLTIVEVFSGPDLDQLIKILRGVVQNKQSVKTQPILASAGNHSAGEKFVHTIVPITDANSSQVNRLFIYSERAE